MKNSKRVAATQFHTAKRIDNSRLVRTVEPGKMRHLYKALALSSLDGGRCLQCGNPRTGRYCPKCGSTGEVKAA